MIKEQLNRSTRPYGTTSVYLGWIVYIGIWIYVCVMRWLCSLCSSHYARRTHLLLKSLFKRLMGIFCCIPKGRWNCGWHCFCVEMSLWGGGHFHRDEDDVIMINPCLLYTSSVIRNNVHNTFEYLFQSVGQSCTGQMIRLYCKSEYICMYSGGCLWVNP